MDTFKELYLAENIKSLDLLVFRDLKIEKYKPKSISDNLNKIAKKCQENALDQELLYIYLSRYIRLYNRLEKIYDDKKFIEAMHGGTYKKFVLQLDNVKENLSERYNLNEKQFETPITRERSEVIEDEEYHPEIISCQELYNSLENKANILLVDARPKNLYKLSRMNYSNCINVPEECISCGQSANTLAKELSPEVYNIWDNRDKYDVIVLFHWDSTSDNARTKLHQLYSALVEWDIKRTYREPPVILKDGYSCFLDMYPTSCINPLVLLSEKYNELDDLLNIDNINYPTETNNMIYVMSVTDENVEEELMTEEPILMEDEDIVGDDKENNFVLQIKSLQGEKEKLEQMIDFERNTMKLANYKKRILEIEDNLLTIHKQVANETIDSKIAPMGDVTEETGQVVHPIADSEKLKNNILEEQRLRELKKARALKPSAENLNLKTFAKPTINRATKPIGNIFLLEPLASISSGLVGLRNIRNTCYMNTVLQCVRHLPWIKDIFCMKNSSKSRMRIPTAILNETSDVVRQLWSKHSGTFEASDFYNKVCQLEPTYKMGNHEDCMEFFLFLLNNLSEDCTYTAALPHTLTTMQQAWVTQFDGKNSIFIDNFYHQIRIRQSCTRCRGNTYKFEIESTFMVSVPDQDFSISELMKEYMADYTIREYLCSKCNNPVLNRKDFAFLPKNVVIVLKRYKQTKKDGSTTFNKITSKAHFELENFKLGENIYRLHAIALHSGDMNFGHYTAAALSSQGWYEFNDDSVRQMNINDDAIKTKACAFFYSN